jgi:hypothetical protein
LQRSKEKEEKVMIMENKAQQLADEHWAWLSSMLEKVYKDALIHGYKHGFQDGKHR